MTTCQTTPKVPHIALLDSGVGGASLLVHLRDKIPQAQYIYGFDNGGFPYGERSEEEIIERQLSVAQKLSDAHPLDLIVVACNTASTLVLPHFRQKFTSLVVGVVPAIKVAAKQSLSGSIGLLATPATVHRPYTNQLIRDFANSCQVTKVGSVALVEEAEKKYRREMVDLEVIAKELTPLFLNSSIDTVVLGCTHFSHLIDEFKQVAPRQIHWLDPNPFITNRVVSLVEERCGRQPSTPYKKPLPKPIAYTTSLESLRDSQKQAWYGAFGIDSFRSLKI